MEIFQNIPNLSIYIAILGFISVWVTNDVKCLNEARKSGDWSSVWKRATCLVASCLLCFALPPVMATVAPIVSKIITSLVVAAFASDGIYAVNKSLQPNTLSVLASNPFVNEEETKDSVSTIK